MNLKDILGGMALKPIIAPMLKSWEKKILDGILKNQQENGEQKNIWVKLKPNKENTKVIWEVWETKDGKNIFQNKHGYLSEIILKELSNSEKNGTLEKNIDVDKILNDAKK